jgi:adenosylmethionine-8-amino-7-oxononanoate aminotransferase
MSGTINGRDGHHVLLAPPYIIDESHADEIVDKLDGALSDAIDGVKAA